MNMSKKTSHLETKQKAGFLYTLEWSVFPYLLLVRTLIKTTLKQNKNQKHSNTLLKACCLGNSRTATATVLRWVYLLQDIVPK